MQEGDTELGGLQIPHGNNVNPPTPTPGPQPVAPATPQNPQPIQSDQSVSQLTSQTFIPNNTINEETQLNGVASQPVSPPQQTPPPQSFQQFSNQSTPSNTGDVILSDASPQQSRKGPIIATIVCLALLMIIGISVYFVIQNNGNKITDDNVDTETSLNRYSSYLLYQVENKEKFNENLAMWPNDKINENLALPNEQNKVEYFDTLIALFNTFSDSYYSDVSLQETLNADKKELLNGLSDNNKSALEALRIYATIPNLSMEDMAILYFTNGGNGMIDYVNEIYADIVLSNNTIVSNYGESKINLAHEIVGLYDVYNSLGCISDNTLIDSCIENNKENAAAVSKQISLSESVNNLNNIEWHMINDVTGLSQMLYESFYGTENENE